MSCTSGSTSRKHAFHGDRGLQCGSGFTRRLACAGEVAERLKGVYVNAYRGFESLPLRHYPDTSHCYNEIFLARFTPTPPTTPPLDLISGELWRIDPGSKVIPVTV